MGGGSSQDRRKWRRAQQRLARLVTAEVIGRLGSTKPEPAPSGATAPLAKRPQKRVDPEAGQSATLVSLRAWDVTAFVLAIVGYFFVEPEYFPLALTFITVACCLFVWEGWRERRGLLGWIKIFAGAGFWSFYAWIVFGTYALRIHPVATIGNYPPGTVRAGIQWKDEYSEFMLSIRNASDSDFQNVNVTLAVKKLSVAAVRQDTSDPSNTTTCNVVRESDEGFELPRKFWGRDQSGRVVEQNAPYVGTIGLPYRMICATLPHRSAVVLVAAIRNGMNPFAHPPDVGEPRPKKMVEEFCFDAKYTVGRRIREVQACPPMPVR